MPDETAAEIASVMDRTQQRALREKRIADLATLLLFAGIALILMLPLLRHVPWMVLVQDDFLYYLKVAQNIASGHGSTFNSLVSTNGYQPLWLMVLVVLSRFTSNPQAILIFLASVDFIAAVATFLLARKLLRRACGRPLLTFALAAYITIYSVSLFFYGMEVTLVVPLLLGVMCLLLDVDWLSNGMLHAFALGLLLSLMVLARIDTLILGGMLLAGIVLRPSLRRLATPPLVFGAALGIAPVAVYLLLNHLLFQTWLPISGMAKEMRLTHTPSLEPWRVFFHPLAAGYGVVLLAAFVTFWKIKARLSDMEQVVFLTVLAFPFVYYGILSCVSDWTLWGWYMYPLRTAMCVSFLLFCLAVPSRHFLQHRVVTGLLVVLVFASLGVLRWTRQQSDIYAAALEIQAFAQSHPGAYAMGDRAGRVGYLIPYPLVQTEGLMMDRAYLRYIEAQAPLREVLAHYHVRYYVGTAYVPFRGCYQAMEPAKGGPTSAKLRGTFCEKPAAHYEHDGVETLIYDLEKPLAPGD